ncbi:heterokaryon incompatibility protein-domain-containing protein [Cladorrhinum sp. PSN259]|nr:heterokaryon incompatibility protein-domain-containing protein [Cladorrhinum sp. PSN259]
MILNSADDRDVFYAPASGGPKPSMLQIHSDLTLPFNLLANMQPSEFQTPSTLWVGIRPLDDTFNDAASNLSSESHVARVGITKDSVPSSKRGTQLPQSRARIRRNRRKVALMASRSLCSNCSVIDFSSIFGAENISRLDGNAGYLICILSNFSSAANCPLCRFFWSVSVDPEFGRPLMAQPHVPGVFGLFAFSGKDTINLHHSTSWIDPVWLAVLPVRTGWDKSGKKQIGYRSWERRGLPLIMQSTRVQRSPTGRALCQQADFHNFRQWLGYCTSHHTKTCVNGRHLSIHGFRVIDCVTRDIKSGNSIDRKAYVALSYLWGSDSPLLASSAVARLPERVPRVIEDAIEATRQLGFRFLWVDRYCIRQDRLREKHEQIQRMGDIYEHAVLTIIAAAGNCSSYGLPGVRNTPRSALPPQITVGYHVLVAASTDIGHELERSKWNTRGWTYQEALLSRRCLVFTDTQVYFQCKSMSCLESFSIPLDDLHDDQHSRFYDDLTVPRVLPDLSTCNSEIELSISAMISQFSLRSFSIEADALDAFRGILKAMKRYIIALEAQPASSISELDDAFKKIVQILR